MLAALVPGMMSAESKFYKPAQYRWFLESLDFSAGYRSSEPVCQVIDTGITYPVVIKPEIIFSKSKKTGTGKTVVVIRKGIVGEVFSTAEFSPGKAWVLPYLPCDLYRILFKEFDADGSMINSVECCLNIIEDMTGKAGKVVPEINKNIFTASVKDGKLTVSGIPSSGSDMTVHVFARNGLGSKLFEQIFKLDSGRTEGEFKLRDIEPGRILNLSVTLETPKKVVDRTDIFYYKRGTFPAKAPDWGKMTTALPPLKGIRIHENQLMMGDFKQNLPGLNALVKGMKERGSDMVNLNFKWNHVEPLCGLYDWSQFDKYVEFFTRKGIRFGIIVGGGIFNSSPYDAWGEWIMDDQGRCRLWRKLCVTSPSSMKYRNAMAGLVRAVYDRYGSNPNFLSWVFSGQGLDSAIFLDHFDRITDYSRYFRADFIAFLKQKYITLDKLNQAWGTSFKDWSAITQPLPDFKAEVDISQPWIDFNACKLKIYRDSNTRFYEPIVREFDKKRHISSYLTYTGPIEYLFPDMQKYGSHLNDGGGEAHQMVRLYSVAVNWGIRRQPESHYVPADKRRQFQDLVTNTMRYGLDNSDIGMVWNSMVNVHATSYPKNKGLKDSMNFWTKVLPELRKLSASQADAPPVGFIMSWDDVFCRTRAWRWYALPGDEMQRTAAKVSLGNAAWLSGITPDKVYDRIKLIFSDYDNRVFSPELLKKLEHFVKRGGTLVLSGTAGEYTVGKKQKYFWKEVFNAPKGIENKDFSEWKFGTGKVVYSAKALSKYTDGSLLVDMMKRCGIKRKVVSSNPAVQGFLLKNDGNTILVVSAFKGFDALRKLKSFKGYPATITLPDLPSGEWEVVPMYPAGKKEMTNATSLKRKGLQFNVEPSGLIIIKLIKK